MAVAGIAHLDANTHTHTHTQYLFNYIGHQRLKKEERRQAMYCQEQ